jgi:hypothetical protein
MSPRVTRDDVWVLDDESTTEGEHPPQRKDCQSLQLTGIDYVIQSLHKRLKALSRVGPCGNKRPPIGQMCLVMVGKIAGDQGQVGMVTRHTPCRVEISVPVSNGAPSVLYMKKPSSLVMLEPGLMLVQDDDGSVWIRSKC